MEETVPHASSPNNGATSRHQAQHRNTGPLTTASNNLNSTATSAASTTADVRDDNIDSDDDELRRRHHGHRSATSYLTSLPLLLSKLILLITIFLRALFSHDQ